MREKRRTSTLRRYGSYEVSTMADETTETCTKVDIGFCRTHSVVFISYQDSEVKQYVTSEKARGRVMTISGRCCLS